MKLSKEKLLEAIQNLVKRINKFVTKEVQIYLHEEFCLLHYDQILPIYHWFDNIIPALVDLEELYKCQSDEYWAKDLSNPDFNNHYQVILYRQKVKTLRKSLTGRPEFLRKSKINATIKRIKKG